MLPAIALAATLTLSSAPESESVVWHAPAPCPDAPAMRREVARLLGRELSDPGVTAHGVITIRANEPDRPPEYELQLTVSRADDAPLRRVLIDRDCSVLGDAAALTIAIAIDPDATWRDPDEPPPEPPSPRPPEAPSTPPIVSVPARPVAIATPPPVPDTRRTRRRCTPTPGRRPAPRVPCVALGADVGLALGPLPRLGPTIGGGLSLLFGRIAIELGARHLFRQPARVQSNPSKGGDIALTHAMLGACARLGVGRAEFPLCADIEAGAFTGSGTGVSDPGSARVPWLASRLGAAAMIAPIRRLALGLRADAVVPWVRYRFAIDGLGTVHRPSQVGLRAGFVIEARLP